MRACIISKSKISVFSTVIHNQLLAHAAAWHTYNNNFRSKQKGKVSIVLATNWFEPKTATKVDKEAADRCMQWVLGSAAHPVFVNGDYPEVMKRNIKEKSEIAGVPNRYG